MAKPQFSINFEKSDIPVAGHRAFGAYISPVPESSGSRNTRQNKKKTEKQRK